MIRVGLTIGLKEDQAERYAEAHRHVPEHVLAAMADAHVTNFSIFHDRDRLFGYLEYHGDDFEADMEVMGANPAMQDWWELTTGMQVLLPGSSDVYAWTPMEQVFFMS